MVIGREVESEGCEESLGEEEVGRMNVTLRKLKFIQKQGRLTQLKKSRPAVNELFRRMSELFLTKKQQNQKKYKPHSA